MMLQKIKNRIGIRYGRLIVIEFAGQEWDTYNNIVSWLCKCDCGNETVVGGGHLQSGNTKSCGCLNKEIRAINQTGKNNYNYVNGIVCGKYTKDILELKELIRKCDNYTCQECDKTQEQNLKETGRILDVHHIDGNDTNNAEENMITLCKSCHSKKVVNENKNS